MAKLFGTNKRTLSSYQAGRTFDPEQTTMGMNYDQLYNNKATLTDKNTGQTREVDVDPNYIELSAADQLSVKNNKNFKDTQKRLQSSGVSAQQSILGGGGY